MQRFSFSDVLQFGKVKSLITILLLSLIGLEHFRIQMYPSKVPSPCRAWLALSTLCTFFSDFLATRWQPLVVACWHNDTNLKFCFHRVVKWHTGWFDRVLFSAWKQKCSGKEAERLKSAWTDFVFIDFFYFFFLHFFYFIFFFITIILNIFNFKCLIVTHTWSKCFPDTLPLCITWLHNVFVCACVAPPMVNALLHNYCFPGKLTPRRSRFSSPTWRLQNQQQH